MHGVKSMGTKTLMEQINSDIEKLYQKGYLEKKMIGKEIMWRRTAKGTKYMQEIEYKKEMKSLRKTYRAATKTCDDYNFKQKPKAYV